MKLVLLNEIDVYGGILFADVVKEPLKDQTHDSGLESLRQSKSPVVT